MKRDDERRDGIEDADDTGMIAGERLITQAETFLPLGAGLPHEELHAALPHGHPAHETIDRLHAEVSGTSPNAAKIREHVGALGALPEVRARLMNWFEDSRTQAFIAAVDRIGL
jgi:hypothetical protein